MFEEKPFHLFLGDCREKLKEIPDNTVDAVVSDPPYELGFMGKSWDASGIAYNVGMWKEVLRVLKPGGHMLAFSGTRTYHRMVCAIEDAGFEIRDQLQWIYGSGFPKSLDISKAVDKCFGKSGKKVGVSHDKHYSAEAVTAGASVGGQQGGHNYQSVYEITEPESEAAKQWKGWGTALKPANEPVVYAKKKFEPVPFSDIFVETFFLLEIFLWFCVDAQTAKRILKSNQATFTEGSFVRPLAEWFRILESEDSLEKTDTFNLQGTALTFWSIVTLWKRIWDESFIEESTSTIRMRSSLTTDLRTLNLSILRFIPVDIIRDALSINGFWLNASIARSDLKNLSRNDSKNTFVPGNALQDLMQQIEKELASIAERFLNRCQVSQESFARSDAQTEVRTQSVKNSLNVYVCNANLNLIQFLIGSPNTAIANAWEIHSEQGLSPNSEPIVLARKPIEKKNVAHNVLKWGTGGINVDAGRIESPDADLSAVQKCQTKQTGDTVTLNVPGHTQQTYNQLGRFPSNVILDEEAARMLDEQSGPLGSGGSKRNSKKSELHGWTGTDNNRIQDGGLGASRFFYVAKTSKHERNFGLDGMPERRGGAEQYDSRWKEGVGEDRMPMNQNSHPTVKPFTLMRYLIRLITPPGGVVLDPFLGSGTTGTVAVARGFKFIGIELNAEYLEIAKGRIASVKLSDLVE